MVLTMKRPSCDRKKTLPDLPGEESSRNAMSPGNDVGNASLLNTRQRGLI